jgi:hypothetical protein
MSRHYLDLGAFHDFFARGSAHTTLYACAAEITKITSAQ